ncbi:MAG: hypothetical protein L0G70_08735 [Rubrobacter sp.]|nr:hypothetical protein [Rubrobacter sp.]
MDGRGTRLASDYRCRSEGAAKLYLHTGLATTGYPHCSGEAFSAYAHIAAYRTYGYM